MHRWQTREGSRATRKRSALTDTLRTIVVAVPIALFLRVTIVEAYMIPSASMENTILVGDRLFANKFIYGARIPWLGIHLPALREPRSGDVIIFQSPTEPGSNFIKRCIAVGGQRVEIRDKQVFVDGHPISLPREGRIDARNSIPQMDNYGPVVVPQGHLFVLGDNRDNSADSRSWGFLPRDHVLGKAILIYWSLDPEGTGGFWRRIRWNRIGDPVL